MNSSIDQLSQVSGLDVLFMGALSVRGGRETPGGEEAKGQELSIKINLSAMLMDLVVPSVPATDRSIKLLTMPSGQSKIQSMRLGMQPGSL